MIEESMTDGGLIWLFGQMIRLPLEAFVYSMEMLLETTRGWQRMANRGIESATREAARALQPAEGGIQSAAPASFKSNGATGAEIDNNHHKETKRMPDTNLSDDTLKLVRSKVLFVKRGREEAFQEQEDLVYDNMTGAGFSAWKVAEFIQAHPNRIDHADKKYLRVYYEVLERYPREKLYFEDEQLDRLERIERAIRASHATAPANTPVPPAHVITPPPERPSREDRAK